MSNSNYFGYSYFSGANCFVKINGVPALEMAGISYQVQESTQPIYGYSSRIFDAVAMGQKIVRGNFVINFIQPNYLAQTIHLSRSGQNLTIQNDGPSVREQLDDFVNGGSFNIRRAGNRSDSEMANIKSLQNYRDHSKAQKEFEINLNKYAEDNQIALESFQASVKAAKQRDSEIELAISKAAAAESSYVDPIVARSIFDSSKASSKADQKTEKIPEKTRLEKEIEIYERVYSEQTEKNNALSNAAVKEYYSNHSLKNIEKIKKEYEAAVVYFEENSYSAAAARNAEELNRHLNDLQNANTSDSANQIIAKITGLEAAANKNMSLSSSGNSKSIFEDYTKDIGLLGPFNIDIQFAEEYTITIVDAFLTSRGSMIQIDENAVVEEYSFFARDIKYT